VRVRKSLYLYMIKNNIYIIVVVGRILYSIQFVESRILMLRTRKAKKCTFFTIFTSFALLSRFPLFYSNFLELVEHKK